MRRTRWRGLSHQSGDAREIPVRHLKREWNLRSGQNRRDLLTSAGTANARETRMNPVDAYPGDEYVDVIGMDFYYNIQWNPADSRLAWDEMVNAPFGLKWLEEFAAAHNKPTAYPEWGVNSDGAGPYIESAAKWFSNHNVLYQRLWNSDSQFRGKLSDGQFPNAADAYLTAFGSNIRGRAR